jgi:hypothetical protein
MNDKKLKNKSMIELLELKEYYRSKFGLYIENNMGERGSFNNKTKPYWSCDFIKRVNIKKGLKHNGHISYQTFNSYKEALIFCLSIADEVNNKFDKQEV